MDVGWFSSTAFLFMYFIHDYDRFLQNKALLAVDYWI